MGTQEAGRGGQATMALLCCCSAPWSPCPLQHSCGAHPCTFSRYPSVAGNSPPAHPSQAPETPCTLPLPTSVSGVTSPHHHVLARSPALFPKASLVRWL